MEAILHDLAGTLKSTLTQLKSCPEGSLETLLHNAGELPDKNLYSAASEALTYLSEIRLLLEPGHLVLADHFLGYMNTKALCAAVEFQIPDILRDGPKTLADLAKECSARQDRLRQVMRTLRNNGIFSYNVEADTYENNHTSTLLLSDHWTQWRSWVDLYGNEFYDMARGIPDACKLEAVRSPAQINFDTDDSMFKYFSDQGWLPKFHRVLSAGAIAQAPGILRDYPWEEVADGHVIDIGGGGGGLIALLLREHKTMQGGILETPHVIPQIEANFHGQGGIYADVGDRLPPANVITGDFFKEVPASEVYTMKWCLHDWDDEKACTILQSIRKAIKRAPKSRLIILESVLEDGHKGRLPRYADMNMMVAVGGRERDERQWNSLAEKTGWTLRKIYPLRNAWPCAIEFVPDWDFGKTKDQSEHAVASMRFLEPWEAGKGNPFIRVDPLPGLDRMNFKWQDYPIEIRDSRSSKGDFTLDANGFAYFDDSVSPDVVQHLRGEDKEAVKQSYYQHVEEFVKKITGAPRVIIFDHTLRKRRLELSKTQNDDGKEQPATMVHCDQSEEGALRRLKMNIGEDEDIDKLLEGRVQLINVWRPLNGPVQDWPLATMDYQTVNTSDMHTCDLLRGDAEKRGQTVTFTHDPAQKWYYLDQQRTDEVTVIKIWDNSKDPGISKFCAHSAFNNPNTPPDVEPRESVEVRCIVIH